MSEYYLWENDMRHCGSGGRMIHRRGLCPICGRFGLVDTEGKMRHHRLRGGVLDKSTQLTCIGSGKPASHIRDIATGEQ